MEFVIQFCVKRISTDAFLHERILKSVNIAYTIDAAIKKQFG